MSDIKLLQECGLNLLEAKIYLYLLQNQPQTMVELAARLGIARTSVYDNVQKLQEKRLVERVVLFKSQKIKAVSINSVGLLIEKQKTELEKMQESFKHLQRNLIFIPDPSIATEVRYYKGAAGLQQMMWNTLSAAKETVGYSVFGRKDVVGEKFMSTWVKEFAERGLQDRVITNSTPEILRYIKRVVIPGPHQLKKTDIRLFDKKQLYVAGDTTIYNNTYAVCYWKEGEVVGFEIDNPEYVRSQRSLFELLWKEGEKLN